MIVFWVAAALFTAVALWSIVRPLLRRRHGAGEARDALNITVYGDQARELDADLRSGLLTAETHEIARRELESRLLEDVSGEKTAATPPRAPRLTAYALALIVPLSALGVYLVVGSPGALDPAVLAANEEAHAIDSKQLQAMVQKLEQRLQENPEDGQGWHMLAKSHRHFGRFSEAARAYAAAVARLPPDASLLADYADVLAVAQGRQLRGEPEKLIARALELDPKHMKSLALAGTAAYDSGDYARAVQHWQHLLSLVEPGSEDARAITASIEEARGLGGIALAATPTPAPATQSAVPTEAPAAKSAAPAAAQAGVSGIVSLAPALAAKVAPTDTVFIYARAAEGSRMPLAIVRKQVSELPARFALDDTNAMSPAAALSKQPQVVVTARVSKSASATAQPGDFEGRTGPVKNSTNGIAIVIDSEVR